MVHLELPALVVKQEITFYVAKINAGDLVDHYQVDRWNRVKNPDGYQRKEFDEKIDEFKNYLMNPDLVKVKVNLIDQTVLANIRGNVSYGDGKLTIDGEMFVVDGQHRTAGLREACKVNHALRELEVPMVFLNVDKDTERARFFIINEKTKRVDTDLAERQLERVHPEIAKLVKSRFDPQFVGWAIKVVDALNQSSSVWKDVIVVRGEAT